MNKLANEIRERLLEAGVRPADKLVVAVSGGPDSMALLDLLRKTNYSLIVAHINHGLREEADRDQRVVTDYGRRHKLAVMVRSVKLGAKRTGIEERARTLRYAALAEVMKTTRAQWVVTAHIADDQVETVVANWLRGSAVRGLGGMHLRTGQIVRPLLGVWKKDILSYVKAHRVPYVVDKSNKGLQFTRNRIRHQLLPILRKFNPQIDEQLWRNSQLWQQADQALQDQARQLLDKLGTKSRGKLTLSLSKLGELSQLMQIEVAKLALEGELTGVERTHFAELMKIMASPKAEVAKRRLGGRLFAAKARDKITISQN